MMLKIFAIMFLMIKTLYDIAVETAPLFKEVLVIVATKVRFLLKEIYPVLVELIKELAKEFKDRKSLKKA